MNKSPVSMLQEIMARRKIVPQYILIYDGTGTQNASFTYQVSCNGTVETGTGRSKKDAKHNAADAALKSIAAQRELKYIASQGELKSQPPPETRKRNFSASIEDSALPKKEQGSSYFDIPKALQQVCISNNLPIPDYKTERHGPPGSSIFTVICMVSSLNERASATTVEEAKAEAARKVWANLQIDFEKRKKAKYDDVKFHKIVRSAETLLQSFSDELPSLTGVQNKETDSVLTEFALARNVPFVDTVEVLNEMCDAINVQKPVYEYTVAGPANAQIFTAKCVVSTFKKRAVAKIRKEAKREVAKKMIEKIQSTVQKLQNSDKFDLNCEEAQFFVKGTVMAMLETITDDQDDSEEPYCYKGSLKKEKKDHSGFKEKIESKNPVHALTKLCKENSFQEPHFVIKEQKLFYSSNYTAACFVSTFKEESMSGTVEQAKDEAAKKMLDKFVQSQDLYLEQFKTAVKKLDYKNPLRWKSQ